MNFGHLYNILLCDVEYVIEENKFSEYSFGINFPEMLAAFDKSIINIVAYKKMLHCLETVKCQINDNRELQDEYLGRIEILKLKLENKLNVELLKDENQLKKINEGSYSRLKPEMVKDEILENNPTTFTANNYLKESLIISKDNMEQNTIDYNKFDKKIINDQFKDELIELAEEMKYSAFRFQELLGKEKKVSFFFFFN